MADTSSIGKVVQTIMESLSEAVSGLILLVMSFQESSAPMPPHIPPAADGVASTSNTLADVATGIAEDEYGDYPDIQNPILAAAKEVRSSSAALLQAVNFLKSNSDRRHGWSGLLDACRTISGDTVYILQLVYGAELQILLFTAQKAKALADTLSSNTAAKNPQSFADQVSDLAGHAEGLSNFIQDRTKDEESPLAKERQLKNAADLAKISNELPELANHVLKSPQDPKAKKSFDDKVRELEKELEVASIPVREKLALQPSKPTPLGTPAPPRPAPAQEKHRPAQTPVGKPPHPAAAQPPPEPREIPKYADKAKEALHNLSAASAARDAPAVARDAQTLVDAVAPFVDSLERLAQDSVDPERKKQLKQAAEDVRSSVPKALAASAQQLKEPAKNNVSVVQPAQKLEKLIEAAKSIARPAPEVEIAAASRNIATDLPAVVAAAQKGDPKATEEALKNLASLGPKLDRHLKEFAEKPVHPLKRAQAADAAKKLDTILPEIAQAAKDVAAKPTEKKPLERLEKAKQAAEDVLHGVSNLGTELLADARKQADDLTRLEVSAHHDEPKKVSETEKTIVKRQPKVAQAAKNLSALTDDPLAKKNLVESVGKLDKLIPEQVRAAQEVAKSGGAEEPKKKLGKNIAETRKALADVANAAEQLPPIDHTPKPAAEVLLDQIQEFMDAMASQDPNDEQAIQSVMSKFADPLQKFLADIPEKDEDDIIADKLQDLAHDLGNELEELVHAADQGKSQAEIDRLGSAIAKKGKELVALAKPLIEKVAEPEDKPLLFDALDDLSALLPEMISSAKELAKNPRDPRAKKDNNNVAAAIQKNVKFVINKAKPPAEVVANNAARKFPKAVKKVVEAMKEDDPNALRNALDNLRKTVRDMNKAPVKDEPNYLAGKNIAKAVEELEKQLANKNNKSANEPPTKPFQDAKKAVEKILADPKLQPKPNPTNEVLADVRDATSILDRLAGLAEVPNKDPKKIVDATKALNKKIDPIIKAAKVEAEKAKDPAVKKKIEDAIKELEKSIPNNIQATKELVQNPQSEAAKKNFVDSVEDIRAPLVNLYAAITPDGPSAAASKAAAIARQEDVAATKLANAANKGDVKAAQDALKSLKDLQDEFKKAAKNATAKAPERVKADVAKSIADLDELLKRIEPTVQNLTKNKDDPKAREAVVAAAQAFQKPLEKVIETVEAIPAATEGHAVEVAKQILASIRSKTIKKVDPRYLLQVSKELAGLLSDMVSKTRDELVKDEDNLTDRAKAALDLDRLLTDLDNSSKPSSSPAQTQSVEDLLASLSALAGGASASGGNNKQTSSQPTELTQQISGVAKDIKAKTANSGSLEGTQLHALSQNLAADLQKFADADSGNSRSDLIVVAKSVSAHIVGLSNELSRLAKLCTDPKIQDKLFQSAQVLRNYATQLKIMASVRAASQRTHGDSTTDQLVILAKNLSSIVGEATNAVSIMKQSKRGL